MNLVIDIGNSRTKLVAFHDGQPVDERIDEGHRLEGLETFCKVHTFAAAILSTVVDLDSAAEARLQALPCPLLRFTALTPVPLQNRYRTPETLGSDRLAAAVGAWTLRGGRNLLVIDAGSCITFDLVTADGAYVGGNITPGVQARLRAIDDYFPRLPLVEQKGPLPELGYDTQTAIRAGVVEGIRHEIEGYIRHFSVKYPDLLVFLTGGDDFHFESPIKSRIFADPFIVPRGLEAILTHHLVQKPN